MLLYHHCRSLKSVAFAEVWPYQKYSDPYFKEAYLWLQKQVGFYPLFISVGRTTDDIIKMTGYDDNWRRRLSYRHGKCGKVIDATYRKAGEFPNEILFSFEDIGGAFTDFQYWHIALNAALNNQNRVTDYERRLIFKPSWPKSKWLRKAKEDPQSVQLVTPSLYLPAAKRIYVRNIATRKTLEKIGFENIEVKRVLLDQP